ncbi:MAG: GYD domain-containing protein [Rhizobiaceae bacterium]
MGLYCFKIQYTPEAIATIVKTSSNREEAAKKAVESVGGKLHGFYGIFGDPEGFHVMLIAETPSNAEYLATVVSSVLGGAVANVRTNVLYSAADMVKATEIINNSGVDYAPPGS